MCYIALCSVTKLALRELCQDTVWDSCNPNPHDARHDGRQQGVWLRARQHEPGIGRRLLEGLQERIRGLRVGPLWYQSLRVADDEHLAAGEGGREVELPRQQAHRGDPMAR